MCNFQICHFHTQSKASTGDSSGGGNRGHVSDESRECYSILDLVLVHSRSRSISARYRRTRIAFCLLVNRFELVYSWLRTEVFRTTNEHRPISPRFHATKSSRWAMCQQVRSSTSPFVSIRLRNCSCILFIMK